MSGGRGLAMVGDVIILRARRKIAVQLRGWCLCARDKNQGSAIPKIALTLLRFQNVGTGHTHTPTTTTPCLFVSSSPDCTETSPSTRTHHSSTLLFFPAALCNPLYCFRLSRLYRDISFTPAPRSLHPQPKQDGRSATRRNHNLGQFA